MEIIKISEHNGEQVVSARDLHEFLILGAKGGQKGEDFSNWIKRKLEHVDAKEGLDYSTIEYDYLGNIISKISESESQQVRIAKRDYALTIAISKEISMIQNNDKGQEARKYFIQCEKVVLASTKRTLSPKELAQMVIDAENEKETKEFESLKQS